MTQLDSFATDLVTPVTPVTRPAEAVRDGDWLGPREQSDSGLRGTRSPKKIGAAIGLLAVGALAGSLGSVALRGTNLTSSTSSTRFGGGTGAFPGGAPAGTSTGTGTAGAAASVTGAITAVGTSSVTVAGTTSTVTYRVSGATTIRQGTTAVKLSALRVGEQVTVTRAAGSTGAAAAITVAAATATTGQPPAGTTGAPPTGTTGQPPAGGPPGSA